MLVIGPQGHIYKRTDHDEEGNPYPLLYMKRG